MRLLFLDFNFPQLLRDAEYPVGGWTLQLGLLLKALSRNGHSVGVMTLKGAANGLSLPSHFDLIEMYDPDEGYPKLRFLTHRVEGLVAAARSYAPDILLQSCSSMDTGVMAYAAGRLRVPFVHRIAHDYDTDGGYRAYVPPLERLGYRYGLRRAQMIICQNNYQREKLRENFPKKALLRMDNLIEVPEFPGGMKLRDQRNHVAWIGNFKRMKNVALLLRVAQELPEIEFRVAGHAAAVLDAETGGALEGLKRLPNVRLLGYVQRSGIFALLSEARALLCTSRAEGFPNTFLEAFATGTPVVTPSGVDPNSMVARNELGFVCAGEESMVANLRRVWNMDAIQCDELAARCRDYVVANHGPAMVGHVLVPALERLAADSARER